MVPSSLIRPPASVVEIPPIPNDELSNIVSLASLLSSLSNILGGTGSVEIMNIQNGGARPPVSRTLMSIVRSLDFDNASAVLSKIRNNKLSLTPPPPPPPPPTGFINSFLNSLNARPDIISSLSNWKKIHFVFPISNRTRKSGEYHIFRGLAKSIFITWTVLNSIKLESIAVIFRVSAGALSSSPTSPSDSFNFFLILFVINTTSFLDNLPNHWVLNFSRSTNPVLGPPSVI